jgi:hypothetical protein
MSKFIEKLQKAFGSGNKILSSDDEDNVFASNYEENFFTSNDEENNCFNNPKTSKLTFCLKIKNEEYICFVSDIMKKNCTNLAEFNKDDVFYTYLQTPKGINFILRYVPDNLNIKMNEPITITFANKEYADNFKQEPGFGNYIGEEVSGQKKKYIEDYIEKVDKEIQSVKTKIIFYLKIEKIGRASCRERVSQCV